MFASLSRQEHKPVQCVNCSFHNMPGLAVCGRCGSLLSLEDSIDITRPRASGRTKRLRRMLPIWLSRDWFLTRNRFAGSARRLRDRFGEELAVAWPAPGVWIRFVVPGWAQLTTGQRARGRLFLSLFAAL